jgi:glutamyl-tRNA synthetase
MSPDGAYPGTCRDLSDEQRADRERAGRPAALRLRSAHEVVAVGDRLHGVYRSRVDDVVLRRNDGVPAYNLAVVVDDASTGVEEVVRADDLLPVSPSQAYVGDLLGFDRVTYAHVPLVLGPDGDRLAKRHGSVTLTDLAADGITPADVLSRLAGSLGLARPGEAVSTSSLVDRFDPDVLPMTAWRAAPWPGTPWPE